MGHANRTEGQVTLQSICVASEALCARCWRYCAVNTLKARYILHGVWGLADGSYTMCFLFGEADSVDTMSRSLHSSSRRITRALRPCKPSVRRRRRRTRRRFRSCFAKRITLELARCKPS